MAGFNDFVGFFETEKDAVLAFHKQKYEKSWDWYHIVAFENRKLRIIRKGGKDEDFNQFITEEAVRGDHIPPVTE